MSRTHAWKAAIAAAVLALTACSGGGGDPAASNGSGEELRFIFPNDAKPGIIFYPYFVADDLGFFEEENLKVTTIPSDGSSAATQQMVAGQADAGTPFSAAVVEAFVQGLDTRYVYTYSTGQNFGISVLADKGIESIADLEGKTIGISEADGGEVAVINAAFTNIGLDPATAVEMIPIGQGNATTLAAIEKGEVDAYASSGGDTLLLRARGLDLVDITPDEFTNFPAHGISTTATALEGKRDAIAKLGRAYAKATLFCQTNREACRSIMARLSPAEFEDPVLGDTEMTRLLDITEVPEGTLFGAPNMAAWKAYDEFRLITEPDAEPADLDTFIDDSLVEQFNDFDRDAIVEMAESYSE